MKTQKSYAAFAGSELVAHGDLIKVARTVKTLVESREPSSILVFAAPTGEQVDLDLRGSMTEVLDRLTTPDPEPTDPTPTRRPPGRPKLGVVGREVTLLPRHWEWLSVQPGGASVALRKLVEQARNSNQGQDRIRRSWEAVYRFISAIAGNEPGFEEASRALFAGNRKAFDSHTGNWPQDIREFARLLAAEAYDPE